MPLNGKRWIKLTGIINPPAAGAAGTTSVLLPRGVRIHSIKWLATLPAGKTIYDCFTNIRLKAKNENRIATLAQHDGILALHGNEGAIFDGANLPVPVAGLVCINQPFTMAHARHFTAAEDTALDILPGQIWYAELDYANLAAQATLEVMVCIEPLDQVPAALQSPGMLEKWAQLSPVAGGVQIDWDNFLPSILTERLLGLHIFNPTQGGYVNRVVIKADNEEVFDCTKSENDINLLEAELFPVAGRFDIIPGISGKNSDSWEMFKIAKKFQMRVYFSEASSGVCQVISRTWGPIA